MRITPLLSTLVLLASTVACRPGTDTDTAVDPGTDTDSETGTSGPASFQADPNAWYTLKTEFRGPNECLEGNEAGSEIHGGNAFMNDCAPASGQIWQFVEVPDQPNVYRLRTLFQGEEKCLEGNEPTSDIHGGNAFMSDCADATGQMWRAEPEGDWYLLHTVFQGEEKCLEGNEAASDVHGGNAFMTDCSGATGQHWQFESVPQATDADHDGYTADQDCDDTNAAVNPAATEACNTIDDDCDGDIDEAGATGETTWFADADADTFGDANTTLAACDQPAGYVASNTDCNDSAAAVNPAATEACNTIDDDCDGDIDEAGATGETTWFADADADTFGDANTTLASCDQPAGYVASNDDCNDGAAAVNPGATEACNTIDDDCDGDIDEAGATGETTWFADADADAFGDANTTLASCDQPAGYVASNTDCNDGAAAVNPGASEIWYDGVDQDCSGTSDFDQDGDGHDASFHGGDDCADQNASLFNTCSQGTGADGSPSLAAGPVVVNDYAALTADATAGATSVSVASSVAFQPGDELMVVQSRGTGSGAYEFAYVVATASGTLTLDRPLAHDYSATGEDRAQTVRVPNFTDLTVPTGTTLAAQDWDGDIGGVLALRANGTLTVDGAVSVEAQGFRGVPSIHVKNHPGDQGEGDLGLWGTTRVQNGNGGGGGERNTCDCCWAGAGAGGGHSVLGSDGSAGGAVCQLGGLGGDPVGNPEQTLIYFGGAGGQGGADEDGTGSDGANGGGIAYLGANSLIVNGTISADGQSGAPEVNISGCGSGGGGGGAGGAIYLDVETASLGTNLVTALGGLGGDNLSNCGTRGGDGAEGRITVVGPASGLSGSTTPTFTNVQ